ncbi:MAG: nucleotidyltransferase family protein [Euryarchaeota archaeon]|nr:nucleotidyltransferase family protein [Euryarchaeota archaeon]
MKIFLLAAGVGSRLRPYTDLIPKALLPVAGRPVLIWILERLKTQGFKKVVLCINEHFKNQFEYHTSKIDGIRFEFSASKKPLGTAGEILNCKHLIDDSFIVYYCDELTEINLRDLVKFHRERNGVGTLALVKNIPLEVGVVETDNNGSIQSFIEKPPLEKLTWAGIGVFEKEILNFITRSEGLDFAKDIFPAILKAGKKLYGYVSEATWLDVGLPHHLEIANKLLSKQKLH